MSEFQMDASVPLGCVSRCGEAAGLCRFVNLSSAVLTECVFFLLLSQRQGVGTWKFPTAVNRKAAST